MEDLPLSANIPLKETTSVPAHESSSPNIYITENGEEIDLNPNNYNRLQYKIQMYTAKQVDALLEKINKGDYTLPIASSETLGGIKVGEGLAISEDGTLNTAIPYPPPPYELPVATHDILGGVKIGGKYLSINEDGLLEGLPPYELPTASSETLGGVKVGCGLTIDESGLLAADPYELPVASSEILGGVKVGCGLTIEEDGTLNATSSAPPSVQIPDDPKDTVFHMRDGSAKLLTACCNDNSTNDLYIYVDHSRTPVDLNTFLPNVIGLHLGTEYEYAQYRGSGCSILEPAPDTETVSYPNLEWLKFERISDTLYGPHETTTYYNAESYTVDITKMPKLSSVVFPREVYGNILFYNLPNLSSLTLPSGRLYAQDVDPWDTQQYKECANLTAIYLPLYGNIGISAPFPETVESITVPAYLDWDMSETRRYTFGKNTFACQKEVIFEDTEKYEIPTNLLTKWFDKPTTQEDPETNVVARARFTDGDVEFYGWD